MKKILYLIFVAFILMGCAQSESVNNEVGHSSTVEKAMEQGKLALADGDIDKAKSNFHLVLSEDKNNQEVKDWLKMIDQYNQFVLEVEAKNVDEATKILEELKANEKFSIIEGLAKQHEQAFNEMAEEVKEIDNQIAELKKLYNPDDESAMPSEDYLSRSDDILANPYITEEQKKEVENFKKDATDRANKLLAIQAEQQRKAEQEAQIKYDPYEWAPNVKEQFEQDIFNRGYVDSIESIRYEKAGVYNNQGRMEVYGEMDGQEFRIVNVNVKTGDYHG